MKGLSELLLTHPGKKRAMYFFICGEFYPFHFFLCLLNWEKKGWIENWIASLHNKECTIGFYRINYIYRIALFFDIYTNTCRRKQHIVLFVKSLSRELEEKFMWNRPHWGFLPLWACSRSHHTGRCVTSMTTDVKQLTAGGEEDFERVYICFSVNQYLFVDFTDMFTYGVRDLWDSWAGVWVASGLAFVDFSPSH